MWKRYAAVALTILVLTAIPATAGAQTAVPPASPTGLSVRVSLGQVVVRWNSPADPAVSGHRVYRQPQGQEETLAGETAGNRTSLTDGEWNPGQTLTYRVTAVGPAGESERSDPVSITIPTEPVGAIATAVHPTTGEERQPGYRHFIGRYADPVARGNPWRQGWITQIIAPAITWQGNVEDLFRRSAHPAMARIYRMLMSIILHPAVTRFAPTAAE